MFNVGLSCPSICSGLWVWGVSCSWSFSRYHNRFSQIYSTCCERKVHTIHLWFWCILFYAGCELQRNCNWEESIEIHCKVEHLATALCSLQSDSACCWRGLCQAHFLWTLQQWKKQIWQIARTCFLHSDSVCSWRNAVFAQFLLTMQQWKVC